MLKALPVGLSEGPLPAPLRDALPFPSQLWHPTFQESGTKGASTPREGRWVRHLTSWINKDAGKAGFPFPGIAASGVWCQRRSRGLLCARGREAGRKPWLFVCARRCTMCPHPGRFGSTSLCPCRLSPADGKLGDLSELWVKASSFYLR